jgi:hypothetical protein
LSRIHAVAVWVERATGPATGRTQDPLLVAGYALSSIYLREECLNFQARSVDSTTLVVQHDQ